MYFYEIEVYHPFCENDKIVMGHDECFDDHQMNIIVQEAVDECIKKYCNKPLLEKGEEACRMEVGTILKEYLPLQLKNRGFWDIKIDETCSIMDRTLFCDTGVNNNDKFNISLLKLYFTNSHKSQTEAIKASEIVDNILENNDFKDYWTEWGEIIDGKHKGDIVCGFDLDTDMKRGKKLLEDYGFVLEDDEDGFWITGVKE